MGMEPRPFSRGRHVMTVVVSLLRHLLTFVGGAGVLSDDQLVQVAGALLTLGAVAWSVTDKRLAARAAAAPPAPSAASTTPEGPRG